MKRKTLVLALLALAVLAVGGRALVHGPIKAKLDTPFALAPGETARLGSEDFEVTLRSMTDDSGCDDPKDCSVILFRGTLLFRHKGRKLLQEATASFDPGQTFAMKFDGYRIELTTIRRPHPQGPSFATFRVVKDPEPEKKE